MFSLIVFLAMATNMGILVNDRIRMQNAADLGAYAAAYKEAQHLNSLVILNRQIVDKVDHCRDTLIAQPWPNECDCAAVSPEAELFLDNCEAEIEVLAQAFLEEAMWSQSVSPALDVGLATMDANMPGLAGSGSFMHQGAGAASGEGTYRAEGTGMNGNSPVPAIARYKRSVSNMNYPVLLFCRTAVGCVPSGIVPSENTRQVKSWYYKDGNGADIWVMAEATGTPRTAYLDIAYSSAGGDGGYFGGSSTGGTDRMVAVAVAKPFGGAVGPTALPNTARDGNGNLLGPYYAGQSSNRARAAMIDQYRARLAGFPEWQAASGAGEPALTTPVAAMAASISDYASDAAKFRH
jgi:hypothetical protein